MNEPPRMLRVCGTCHGKSTVTRPKPIIGRPGNGPRRIIRFDPSRPMTLPCPACQGTRPAAAQSRRR